MNLFTFTNHFLHDDRGLFLIFFDNHGATKTTLKSFFPSFGFAFLKNRYGINRLFARSKVVPNKTIQFFKVTLLICAV